MYAHVARVRHEQHVSCVQDDFQKAKRFFFKTVISDRMKAKHIWSHTHKAGKTPASTGPSMNKKQNIFPSYVDAQAFRIDRAAPQHETKKSSSVVWVLVVHPMPDESESRIIRTQDARLIVSALQTSPAKRFMSRAIYVLSSRENKRWCTPVARKLLESHITPLVVPCTVADMLFDITEHFLCPPSRRMQSAEIQALCKRLRCPDTHRDRKRVFPHLKQTDPICKMCGYFVGDVVAFDRGSHMYWRVVVK